MVLSLLRSGFILVAKATFRRCPCLSLAFVVLVSPSLDCETDLVRVVQSIATLVVESVVFYGWVEITVFRLGCLGSL